MSFFIFFSTIMVTGHGFGLEDTSNLEHAVFEPIPVANVEKSYNGRLPVGLQAEAHQSWLPTKTYTMKPVA